MTCEEFNAFCRSLPAATHVVQWGGADVWKVGGKVFAIGRQGDAEQEVVFKAGDVAYEILREQPGLRPAPYLASRGLKWIQHYARPGLPDDALRDYIRRSHGLVMQGLTRKCRRELGLDAPQPDLPPPVRIGPRARARGRALRRRGPR